MKTAELSDADARLFACDCAENALRLVHPYLLTSESQPEMRPSWAVWTARGFVAGTSTEDDLRKASDAAAEAAEEQTGAVYHAAYAAAFASEPDSPQDDMLGATMAAAIRAVTLAEHDWQEAALQKYL